MAGDCGGLYGRKPRLGTGVQSVRRRVIGLVAVMLLLGAAGSADASSPKGQLTSATPVTSPRPGSTRPRQWV